MADLQVTRTIAGLRQIRAGFAPETVALVATMGALHDGHRSLMRLAAQQAEHVVVSIFVNPLQFGPGEDYAQYPRLIEHDLEVCAEEGVALLFLPTVHEIYPPGRQIRVAAGPLGTVLEGAARPDHFDGVLTVVLKLFNLVRPTVAIFGEKDAQQLACIQRMVADLNVSVDIVGAPIIREPDGLALSSRNRYLTKLERHSALALSASLRAGSRHREVGAVLEVTRRYLTQTELDDPSFRVDYAALVSPASFTEVPPDHVGEAILAVAAQVGSTRLIDNVTVVLGPDGDGPT